ncbi:MAG: hypothetical protein ACP5P1_10580 [Acidimicrobiales bacterium]
MASSPYVIESEGNFHLDLPLGEVWTIISRTDRFEGWWGWLRDFETDGSSLETGSVLREVVVPFLPYRMPLEVVLANSIRLRRIDAVVRGDLQGDDTFTSDGDGDGTQATAGWTIEMMQRPMRTSGASGSPVVAMGSRTGVAGHRVELPAALSHRDKIGVGRKCGVGLGPVRGQ